MPRVKTFTFEVIFSERDLPGFLDMLRYDSARVISWDRQPMGLGSLSRGTVDGYKVRLNSERYTPERWSSFSIHNELVMTFTGR
jgi:hypothetical protein